MTRPKGKRGQGFSRSKRGRDKTGHGATAQGIRGRPSRLSSPILVGEISDSEASNGASVSGVSVSGASDLDGDFIAAVADVQVPSDVSNLHRTEESTEQENLEEDEASILPTIQEALHLLRAVLPQEWTTFPDQNGIHTVMLSRGSDKAIQRTVFVAFNGDVNVTVHRRSLPSDLHSDIVNNCGESVALTKVTAKRFVDRILSLVLRVRSYEICAGQDFAGYEPYWNSDDGGNEDLNPYDENRYRKTFRSHACHMLVPVLKWKCKECLKAGYRFRHRHINAAGEEYEKDTPNIYLTEEQKKKKLKDQQKQINDLKKKVSILEKRVQAALAEKGVNIGESVSDQLLEALKNQKLTPLQELFIQQQCKSSSVKNKKGMRWHPTLIRFALLVKSESSAAYRAIRASGLINLPGESTLFDYSHVLPTKTGVNYSKIKLVSEKVISFSEEYKKYHNLLFDEIHISNKLVYNKATGEMVGYVNLNEVAEEMAYLVNKVKNGKGDDEPNLATQMLVYMVKGVANGVKEVIAYFLTNSLTKEDLYDYTWDVISALEIAGVKVLSLVCDGNGVNRAFFDMHKPATLTKSGVVFDTTNLCAPERKLYFVSDVPHLLKTFRNCFAKSGRSPRCKKLLTKGGQNIVWSTIERLYLEDHENIWRKSHKLNAMNVYLNSYSCMKVLYAAQVLSKTVALDLEGRKWRGTSETVNFILKVNDFFDCLNGAHSEQGKRKQNPLLNPYTSVDDERFQKLDEFIKYLHDWKAEIDALPGLKKLARDRLFLSHQTVEGSEVSIRGITEAIKYMIKVGDGQVYINARIFCQDPLEQYFSKQRARLGGSRNPNAKQFMQTDNMISIHRDLNVKRRSGNTEAESTHMEITTEVLPKRSRKK